MHMVLVPGPHYCIPKTVDAQVPYIKRHSTVVKVLHSIRQHICKLSSGHKTGKGQFSFQSLRKAMRKNAQTTTQLHSSHTLAK